MRLISQMGELILPSDFQFTIEQKNPAFSKEGTQSIPVTLPDADINSNTLSFPSRAGKREKAVRKMPAKLEAGVIHKDGQLVIEAAQRRSGIVAALMLNESDFYTRIKDVKLEEIFGKIVRNDFSGASDKIEAWYQHIYNVMKGITIDDFTAFPVAVNLNEQKYSLLNEPDTTSVKTPWDLKYKARRVAYENEAVNVPDGYGVTVFLYMYRLIELLFAEYSYTVQGNPFKTDSFLSKVVVLNNTADTICKGFINYSDLVPSCTVADFVEFIEKKFLMHFYISPESKSVNLISLESIINTAPDFDVTEIIHENESYIFSDPSEVDVSSDTTLDGAVPAMESITELVAKYAHVKALTESEFRSEAWKYNFVLRKATGVFYEILRRPLTSDYKTNPVGSNYFKYFTGRLPAKEYKSNDIMPSMVTVDLGFVSIKQALVVCPYIGSSRHRNTSYNEKNEAAEQKIIIAAVAGMADEDSYIAAKYLLGTTQKYNNLGTQWSLYSLTTTDLYTLCFKSWNSVLMNSSIEIEARVDYKPDQLLSLRFDKPKILKGQSVLLKSLSYTVGKVLTNIKSVFVLVKNLAPVTTDPVVTFTPQQYMWMYESNIDTLLAQFEPPEYNTVYWDYVGITPSKVAYEYMPPPTAQQYASGTLYYEMSNHIRIYATKPGDPVQYTFNATLTSGFRAALI